MSITSIVPSPTIVYPIDVSFPIFSVGGAGAVAAATGSAADPNRAAGYPYIQQAASATQELYRAGSSGGGGVTQTYGMQGGLAGVRCQTVGADAMLAWYHSQGQPAVSSAGLPAGYQADEILRVWWLRAWLSWPALVGNFTDDNTGLFLFAFRGDGAISAAVSLPGGTDPAAICGIIGRDDGGVQQARWRAWDDAGVAIDSVDITIVDADQWNQYDIVVLRAPAGGTAQLSVHVNDTLQPALTRPFDGVSLLAPTSFPNANYGLAWGVADSSGAGVTRGQLVRWRLRCGAYLPDGTPVLD